ncbi:MAG: M48 family metalloprotease [Desulfomonilia bacterium]
MKKSLALICAALFFALPASSMTFDQEREIAQEFITFLDAHNLLVYDREITMIPQMIADRIADHISSPIYTFTVHVIRDRSVNAFAIPDGHVFINVGTLLFIQDLDELAAVIGHEIGHSQLRHIPENFETQKKISMAAVVGVLAGTLLSAKNPEAGAALVYSSIGGSENIRLAYSRQHEYEADEFSRNVLDASNIDPSGMTRFLIRLNAIAGSSDIPEYLLTHPHTQNRIVTSGSDFTSAQPDENYWALSSSVIGLVLPENEAAMRADNLPDPYRSLSLGLLKTRQGNAKEAITHLEKIDLHLANAYMGLNLHRLERNDEAYPLLKEYARSADPKMALAEIQELRGQIDEAIQSLLPFSGQSIRVDYKLGVLYQKASKQGLSHVFFARYFYSTHEYKSSLYHIDQALSYEKELEGSLIRKLKEMRKTIQNAQQS